MKTINKERLTQILTTKLGLSGAVCEDLVSDIFTAATNLISTTSTLKIKNFGSFGISTKAARPGMNFVEGSAMSISERKVIRFVPSRNLKMSLQ
jgi:nucleoid DNA-binding protein